MPFRSSSPLPYPANQLGLTASLERRITEQERRHKFDNLIEIMSSDSDSVTEPDDDDPIVPQAAPTVAVASQEAILQKKLSETCHKIRTRLGRRYRNYANKVRAVRLIKTIPRVKLEDSEYPHSKRIEDDQDVAKTLTWVAQAVAFQHRNLPINSTDTPIVIGNYGHLSGVSNMFDLMDDVDTLESDEVLRQMVVFFEQGLWQAAAQYYDPWELQARFPLDLKTGHNLVKDVFHPKLSSPLLVLPSYNPKLESPAPRWFVRWQQQCGACEKHTIQVCNRTDVYLDLDLYLPEEGPVPEHLSNLAEWLQLRRRDWAPIFIDACIRKKYIAVFEEEEYKQFVRQEQEGSFETPRHIRQRTYDICQLAAGIGRPPVLKKGWVEKDLMTRMLEETKAYREMMKMDSDD
ncbi:hypothetical protein SISSUDRAFT_1067834 [Sistotremastrum suecicum HHB10207 ss-3]|uniref:Uncharacterized protein n=1 Tax=Sistotremastrum suecicum HHB10207 ss-3 TaxID=1314776 RepID=A0A165WMT9_9AGAM|nr:hypothetical protein SISSUDRAFT_1067834 [Sistotremastrum suecicum HHB10207 ss-3]